MKTKVVLIFILTAALLILVAGVAYADPKVGKNPNAFYLTTASCDDGSVFEAVVVPAGTASVALVPDSTQVGVAKSLYVLFDPEDPGTWAPVFHRPGKGLPTVWCTWFSEQDGLYFGGHILLTPAHP